MTTRADAAVPVGDNAAAYNVRWFNRVGIWLGIAVNPASISLGGGLAARIAFPNLLWLMPLGCVIIAALCIFAGVTGRRARQRLAGLSAATFGVGIGAVLLNLVMALGMTGWNGFQLGLTGASLASLLGTATWLGVVIMAVSLLALSTMELNKWNGLVWVTTGASFALALVVVLIVGGGPATHFVNAPFTFGDAAWGIGSIVAFAGLFSIRCTDFTYDMASDRDIVIDGSVFGVLLFGSLIIGALLYRATGDWDLAAILSTTEFAAFGLVFVVLSLIAATLSTIHSGSLAWAEVLPVNRLIGMLLIVGAGSALGITRFDRELLPFLDWVGAILPPALAVMLAKGRLSNCVSSNGALIAWLVGAGVGLALKLSGQLIHIVVGAAVSLLVLLVMSRIGRNQKV